MTGVARVGVMLLLAAPPLRAAGQAPAQPAPATPTPSTTTQPPPDAAPVDPPTRDGRSGRPGRTSRRAPARDSNRSGGRPSRSGGPTTQSLVWTTAVLGGYDDNVLAAQGTGAGLLPNAMVSGNTASLDSALAFQRGNRARMLRFDVNGNSLWYPDYLDKPLTGGSVGLDASTLLTGSTRVGARARGSYDPFLNPLSGTGTGPLASGDLPLTGGAPTTGLLERRSVGLNGALRLEQGWGTKAGTTIAVGRDDRRFTDEGRGDSRIINASINQHVGPAQGVRVRGGYTYSTMEVEGLGENDALRSTRLHRVEGGPEITKALARGSAQLEIRAAAGATLIDSTLPGTVEPFRVWAPMGSGTIALTTAGQERIQADYRRDVRPFQGLTSDVFTTDTATVSIGKTFGRRVDTQLAWSYTAFESPVAFADQQTIRVQGAQATLRYFVTTALALTASYGFYRHRFSNADLLPEGFPGSYDRNTVRVGLTVRFPLIQPGSARTSSRQP